MPQKLLYMSAQTRISAPNFSRRAVLLGTGAALAAGLMRLPGAGAQEMTGAGAPPDPDLDLVLRTGVAKAELLETGGPKTDVWAYNETVPGPTLIARRGGEIRVRVDNRLDQATTVHWHGVRIDNAMDGVPGLTQPAIAPGASFDYRFRVPDAGTYWYHPHAGAAEQLGRGLHGLLIVREDTAPATDQELLFVLDDWRLGEDGAIEGSFGNLHDAAHAGRLGNVVTVNGAPTSCWT